MTNRSHLDETDYICKPHWENVSKCNNTTTQHLNASSPTADLSEDEFQKFYPQCIVKAVFINNLTSTFSDIVFFYPLSEVMAGQIVMRWSKVMSRKQMVASQWNYKPRKCIHLMTTFCSCVWTLTQGTRGLPSSGSTDSSVAFLVILRRTRTTRRSAQVNRNQIHLEQNPS